MKYIDTHSHLHFSQYADDRDAVLSRMREQGVGTIVIGTSLETSKQAIALAEAEPDLVLGATIGVHPTDVAEPFVGHEFENLLGSGVVCGVGECGLDYFRTPREEVYETQRGLFAAHIAFAAEHNLPLMLHVRPSKGSDDAHIDALAVLREAKATYGADVLRGTAHFFTGSLQAAQGYWDLGFATSFPGVITFAKETEAVVAACPKELMLSETDAPYAAPLSHRGARNEPTFVVEVVGKIATIRGEEEESVAQQLLNNTQRLFNVV